MIVDLENPLEKREIFIGEFEEAQEPPPTSVLQTEIVLATEQIPMETEDMRYDLDEEDEEEEGASPQVQDTKMSVIPVGNILNGSGYYIWSDGTFYHGEWKFNERFGTGDYQWPDGSKYSGSWKNDQWFGEGTYTNKYGIQFTGLWHDHTLLPGDVYVVHSL